MQPRDEPSGERERSDDWHALAGGVLRDFRRTWPQLALTDLLAKAAGFLLLGPLLALLLRLFVGTGAGTVLVDVEIARFFLRPLGLAVLILAGAVWVGIAFAELASLMTIGFGALEDRRVSYLDALKYAARSAPRLIRLAGQVLARVLLIAAPFLALSGGVYALLLTKHDINYYLSARPSEFKLAVALVGTLLALLAVLLLRLAARWCLALPILLFRKQGAREALRASVAATDGHRLTITLWFVGWWLAATVASSIVTTVVGLTNRVSIPTADTPLAWAALAVGASLLVVIVANALITLLSTSWLALLIVRLFALYAVPLEDQAGPLEGQARLRDGAFGAPGSLGARAQWSFPRRRLLWSSVVAVLAVAAIVFGLIRSIDTEHQVQVAAHRGGAALAPENTLVAIQSGIECDTDWVEIDVQESADGVVTVLHDQDFLRVGGDPAKLWATKHEQVQQIDIGSYFAPEYADQRAPTLEETLAACKGRTKVVIELKYYGHDQQLEERVVEIVEATGMTDQVQIMSLEAAGLEKTRALRPSWTYGLLVAMALGDLSRLDFDFVAVRSPLATDALIRNAHRRGKQVYVWTVDDAVQMSAMISRGVDVLITDQPERAREVIAQYAELNTVQRLLLAAAVRFKLFDDPEPASPDDA